MNKLTKMNFPSIRTDGIKNKANDAYYASLDMLSNASLYGTISKTVSGLLSATFGQSRKSVSFVALNFIGSIILMIICALAFVNIPHIHDRVKDFAAHWSNLQSLLEHDVLIWAVAAIVFSCIVVGVCILHVYFIDYIGRLGAIWAYSSGGWAVGRIILTAFLLGMFALSWSFAEYKMTAESLSKTDSDYIQIENSAITNKRDLEIAKLSVLVDTTHKRISIKESAYTKAQNRINWYNPNTTAYKEQLRLSKVLKADLNRLEDDLQFTNDKLESLNQKQIDNIIEKEHVANMAGMGASGALFILFIFFKLINYDYQEKKHILSLSYNEKKKNKLGLGVNLRKETTPKKTVNNVSVKNHEEITPKTSLFNDLSRNNTNLASSKKNIYETDEKLMSVLTMFFEDGYIALPDKKNGGEYNETQLSTVCKYIANDTKSWSGKFSSEALRSFYLRYFKDKDKNRYRK